jgi:hypothetical protein
MYSEDLSVPSRSTAAVMLRMRKILPVICLSLGLAAPARAVVFDISLNLVGMTSSQEAVFEAAASTWESLITDYKTLGVTPGTQLIIDAELAPIDGVGGILGSAGPTVGNGFGGSFLYATAGGMQFDTADVAALETAGTFAAVILHEMAHVIGIGTLWSSAAAGLPGFQELYVSGSGQYTGATGLAAYQQEFVGQGSATFVPVELGGGGGTANGHWNEVNNGAGATGIVRVSDGRDVRDMLMTGWLNAPTFISDTTLGSFEDLGYNTTLSLAGAIPEPSTAIPLALLGVLAAMRLRRRHPVPGDSPDEPGIDPVSAG